ncbi:hypothetical protein TNCV_3284241, partial [Trichonephila clavipes]
MKEGLIALNYESSKCNERMGLYERKSAVLDGVLNGYVRPLPRRIFMAHSHDSLNNEAFKVFVKIRCHAVASTRKRSAVRKFLELKSLVAVTPYSAKTCFPKKGIFAFRDFLRRGHPHFTAGDLSYLASFVRR